MNIFGIGTDIVNVKRIEKTLRKNGDTFKKRIFSKNEILYCERKKQLIKRIVNTFKKKKYKSFFIC